MLMEYSDGSISYLWQIYLGKLVKNQLFIQGDSSLNTNSDIRVKDLHIVISIFLHIISK